MAVADESGDRAQLPLESCRLHAFRQAQNWLLDAVTCLQASLCHSRQFERTQMERALQKVETAQKWLDRGLE